MYDDKNLWGQRQKSTYSFKKECSKQRIVREILLDFLECLSPTTKTEVKESKEIYNRYIQSLVREHPQLVTKVGKASGDRRLRRTILFIYEGV